MIASQPILIPIISTTLQVIDDSIVRAPNTDEPTVTNGLPTAILLAIIIPVVVGVLCIAGLGALIAGVVILM